jgi:hypothetical protein
MAYDGQAYSGNTSFSSLHVNVAGSVNHAPVVTIPSANVSATAGQVIAASSLFTITDADNDPLTYFLYDGTANGGHWAVNGVAEADQTVIALSASQLAQTTFVAGPAGSSDSIAAMAYDGQAYSGNTSFSSLHVNVAAPTGPLPNTPATQGDNFAFAFGAGQRTAGNYGQGVADNHLPAIDPPADLFSQIYTAASGASINDARAGVGIHAEAAVDPLALFGLHAAPHAADHFGV